MTVRTYLFSAAIFAGLCLSRGKANPVNITMEGGVLVTDSTALSNFGDSTVFNWISSDVSSYDSKYGKHDPAPTEPADKVSTGNQPTSIWIDNPNDYDYLFLHWGGSGGGSEQLFYIGGYTGWFDFVSPDGGYCGNGLSFYSFYGPNPKVSVPDRANTVMLLAFAAGLLAVAGAVKRKLA